MTNENKSVINLQIDEVVKKLIGVERGTIIVGKTSSCIDELIIELIE